MEIYRIPVGAMRVNCYILKDDSGLGAIIDPGGENATNGSELILSACQEHSVKVEYIILTHAHFDHMLSLRAVREQTGAKLAVHKADLPALKDPYISYMAQYANDSEPIKDAEVKLSDGDIVKIGKSQLKVMSTPGHTPGSICLIDDDGKFILTGDTLFRGSVGRCDLAKGDQFELLKSLEKFKTLDTDYKLYPGHGEMTTLKRECECNPFML